MCYWFLGLRFLVCGTVVDMNLLYILVDKHVNENIFDDKNVELLIILYRYCLYLKTVLQIQQEFITNIQQSQSFFFNSILIPLGVPHIYFRNYRPTAELMEHI